MQPSIAPPASRARWERIAPRIVVGVVLIGQLWRLRATLQPAAYLDDASIHNQMVRYAVREFNAGRSPLEGWFPYLGLGSPQFLHYQSLGAMLTALPGLIVGGDSAFRWSLYLLLALWPLVIYGSARLFGLTPWTAAAAAAVAPLLASVPKVGYEHGAYVWIGYGLWTQLWGSWALPFAWAATWRAMDDRRYVGPAAVLVALTIALHFETGYLALMAIGVFPWLRRRELLARVKRAGITLALAVVLCAWVLLPLLVFAHWAARNQVLQGTSLENGYGAHQVLVWLVGGRVFDDGRLPVITIAVAAGIIACIARWRTHPISRALLVVGTVSTVLCFGRTTFGSLIDVVPASTDLFFRRFMFGTQLAGIYLAGIGIVAIAMPIRALVVHGVSQTRATPLRPPVLRAASVGVAACLCAIGLLPALRQVDHYDAQNASEIKFQHDAQRALSPSIGPLISYIKAHGGGRTYAGLPSNWGASFDVGSVPVFKYLESQDVDEVGYTLRTASLMTDPEYYFDEDDPSDFTLFGIHYLLYPASRPPPLDARSVMAVGNYRLWVVANVGYLDVVDTTGSISANRGDVGTKSLSVVHSGLIDNHQDLTVAWDDHQAAAPTASHGADESTPPGSVVSETAAPANGVFRGTVRVIRRSVVLLSASYDPGWQVTVDGRRAPTEILAPALVGVTVSPGAHQIVFRYVGYRHYRLLFALALVGLAGAGALTVGVTRPRRPA